jgi:hypothetical protein
MKRRQDFKRSSLEKLADNDKDGFLKEYRGMADLIRESVEEIMNDLGCTKKQVVDALTSRKGRKDDGIED